MQRSTAVIKDPTIVPDNIVIMSPKAARKALRQFCQDNGFNQAAIDSTFHLFSLAAHNPSVQQMMVTTHYGQIDAATARHDCMEAITSNPLANDLASRAFDLAPGTRLVHSIREDQCVVFVSATNEVIG